MQGIRRVHSVCIHGSKGGKGGSESLWELTAGAEKSGHLAGGWPGAGEWSVTIGGAPDTGEGRMDTSEENEVELFSCEVQRFILHP